MFWRRLIGLGFDLVSVNSSDDERRFNENLPFNISLKL